MQTKAQIGQTLSLVSASLNRFLLSSALFISFSLSNFAIAESSGAFVGVEVGYGEARYELKAEYSATQNTQAASETRKFNGGGVNYGITAGYKHFFNDYFGLRAYGSINSQHNEIKISGRTPEEMGNYTALNFGANLDLLGNFISTERLDFGAFVGVMLGYNYWLGRGIDEDKRYFKDTYNVTLAKIEQNGNGRAKISLNSPSNFDIALNVGLRANIAKHHGIELATRVPFIPMTFATLEYRLGQEGVAKDEKLTIKLQQIWNLNVRYTYSF